SWRGLLAGPSWRGPLGGPCCKSRSCRRPRRTTTTGDAIATRGRRQDRLLQEGRGFNRTLETRPTSPNWTVTTSSRRLPPFPALRSQMVKLLVLHGPNLNLLGTREPEVYGRTTLADIDADLAARATAAGHALESLQSNAEHTLVERVQAARTDGTAFILINPAAFTHTSVALRDALAAVAIP